MKKFAFTLILLTFSSAISFAQIEFKKAYFINNLGQKTECLIKNMDWRNNPTEFLYKLSPDGEIQHARIRAVKEFAITNGSKYIRAKVNIDRSSDVPGKISYERNSEFHEELLFLKVLVEGDASLYLYVDENLTRFFYRLKDSDITQLVYKKFKINLDDISTNNQYKQQLYKTLKCDKLKLSDFNRLKHKGKELKRLFEKYNKCKNSDYINYEPEHQRDMFNLTVRPGLNYCSLKTNYYRPSVREKDFESNFIMRFGIEAEYIFPFHNNKWGLIFEPTFQRFQAEKTEEIEGIAGGILITKLDYKSLELPVGGRYYFFLNDQSKIFIDVSLIFDTSFHSFINFYRQDGTTISPLLIASGPNVAIGAGFKIKDRYVIEIRYSTPRDVLSDYQYWDSEYKSLSIVMGYSLF